MYPQTTPDHAASAIADILKYRVAGLFSSVRHMIRGQIIGEPMISMHQRIDSRDYDVTITFRLRHHER